MHVALARLDGHVHIRTHISNHLPTGQFCVVPRGQTDASTAYYVSCVRMCVVYGLHRSVTQRGPCGSGKETMTMTTTMTTTTMAADVYAAA